MNDTMELLERWDDVDRYLEDWRDQLLLSGMAGPTELYAFHDGAMSGLLDLPPFVLEDADRLTNAIVDLVPQLFPDQVLIVLPHLIHDDDGTRILALRVLRWAAGVGWRQQVWPTTAVEGEEVPPFDHDFHDPWSMRMRKMFDGDVRTPLGVIDTTRLPDDVRFLAASDGPMARMQRAPLLSRRHRRALSRSRGPSSHN